MKLCKKQKILASRLQRPGMTSSLKKLLADYFKTVADGPKTGLLAACAISTVDFWLAVRICMLLADLWDRSHVLT